MIALTPADIRELILTKLDKASKMAGDAKGMVAAVRRINALTDLLEELEKQEEKK